MTVSEGRNHHKQNTLRRRVFFASYFLACSVPIKPGSRSQIFICMMCRIIFCQEDKAQRLPCRPGWLEEEYGVCRRPWCRLHECPVFQTARFPSLQGANVLCVCVTESVCTGEHACPIKASPLTCSRKTRPRTSVQAQARSLGCVLLSLVWRPCSVL